MLLRNPVVATGFFLRDTAIAVSLIANELEKETLVADGYVETAIALAYFGRVVA